MATKKRLQPEGGAFLNIVMGNRIMLLFSWAPPRFYTIFLLTAILLQHCNRLEFMDSISHHV